MIHYGICVVGTGSDLCGSIQDEAGNLEQYPDIDGNENC